MEAGRFKEEICPVTIPQRKDDDLIVDTDDTHAHPPRWKRLAKLCVPFREDDSVTADNASGVNDGACSLLIASNDAAEKNALTPTARIVAIATAGLEPRIMGFDPAPATTKVLEKAGLTLDQIDVIELNEALASQGLAVMRDLGLPDDAPQVNPNDGAIALGHPQGTSGARLAALCALHHVYWRWAGNRVDY